MKEGKLTWLPKSIEPFYSCKLIFIRLINGIFKLINNRKNHSFGNYLPCF